MLNVEKYVKLNKEKTFGELAVTELFISLGVLLVLAGLIFITYKTNNQTITIILRVLSIILFAFYVYFVFAGDFIKSITIGVNEIFTNAELAWINILRWLNNVCVLVAVLAPWFKVRTLNNILAFSIKSKQESDVYNIKK